jgi:hypothetical protein
MPLRPVSELGLAEATDVDVREPADQKAPARAQRRSRRTSSTSSKAKKDKAAGGTPPASTIDATATSEPASEPVRAGVSLGDEPTIFVQAMLAGEVHQRLADASHAIAADHWKLRKYKTILGALLWRHVRADDPASLRELSAALDAFLATDAAEAPAEIKVGAHLPFSLKYSLDGAALALRRTRRDASAKTLIGALIWRYVDPADPGPLAELLQRYDEVSRPHPAPLT